MRKLSLIFFVLFSFVGCMQVSPQLIFRIATENEAFEYVIYTSKLLSYCKKYGYNITLPKHEAFKKLCENPNISFDKDILKEVFVTELYDKSILEQPLKVAYNIKGLIEKALQKLAKLKKNWGFDLKKRYEIVFTSYGVDVIHQYSPKVGKITILANPNTTLQPGWLETTILHKIVNIGIEENIIKKYGLGQWQKERVIDLIIMHYLKEIVPYYRPNDLNKKNADKRIDCFVNYDSIVQDLPSAIEKYMLLISNTQKEAYNVLS